MRAFEAIAVGLAVVVVLSLVVLAVIVVRGLYWWQKFDRFAIQDRCLITDQWSKFKTGDIILFTASAQWLMNSAVLGDIYTHCAVVLRRGNRLYSVETGNATHTYGGANGGGANIGAPTVTTKGSVVLPLLTRLKYYHGSYYVMSLDSPLSAADEKAISRESSTKTYYPSIFQTLVGLLTGASLGEDREHCAQLVGRLLDAADLVPEDEEDLASSGFIEIYDRIINIHGKKLKNGRRYAPPVQILYNAK